MPKQVVTLPKQGDRMAPHGITPTLRPARDILGEEKHPMKLAVGADEKTPMAEAVLADLKRRGHEVIAFGPLAG